MTHDDDLRASLRTLSTESADPAYADLDVRSTGEQVEVMLTQAAQAAAAVAGSADEIAAAVDGIVARRARGGRLIYIGAGTAGRMGVLDASEIPPTYGTAPEEVVGLIAGGEVAVRGAVENAEDDDVAGAEAVERIGLTADDAIVGISASGRTPYVSGALERAQRIGAFTISLAGNTDAAISRGVDVAIEIDAGPEAVAGSTRLKAGTVQKLVLNTLSTLAMVQEGKVLGNLMVDVQATNEKLRVRAERIVMQATGCDQATAADALRQADGSAKVAILIASGADADAAAELLAESRGRLRPALAALDARSGGIEPA
ncbi:MULTISPECIES: N-acetylmuramic acid 6-phosphate etherase [unclassified Microbacterium]|uniref:N-acetylmuramic acid 6-phosphate etherase n=1 Tax=unclassified Microbacterium TaxID=2609290 RepID=UPI0012F96A63|nr:N-acetylmuramic acid 6-phosphate etherase [Microbacterium sp. MAH-37]MVQ41062.1 N-acetylmuramic acid 6-phosphate etherase [Microbacterium sp. MAH-37]